MKRALRAALGAVLPWLLLCWFSISGCGLLGSHTPRVARFECQVRAFKPLVGDVLDAEQLVKDLYAGRANMRAVLGSLKASEAEVEKLMADLAACEPPPPEPPVGEPS